MVRTKLMILFFDIEGWTFKATTVRERYGEDSDGNRGIWTERVEEIEAVDEECPLDVESDFVQASATDALLEEMMNHE